MARYFFVLALFGLVGCVNLGRPISPLIWASRDGDTARLKELIKAGADVDARGGVNDWTPIMHAVHKNQAAALKILLRAGADVNAVAGNQTALIMAAGYGQADLVRMLLDYGADPRAFNGAALDAAVSGTTDIDRFTVGHCQSQTVKALLERDPSLRLTGGSWATRAARLGGCKEVLALLNR